MLNNMKLKVFFDIYNLMFFTIFINSLTFIYFKQFTKHKYKNNVSFKTYFNIIVRNVNKMF